MKIASLMIALLTSSLIFGVDALPQLNLNGGPVVKIIKNDLYSDQGATAFDSIDGAINSNVNKNGEVNTSRPGIYVVSYKVANKSGESISKNRIIIVEERKDKKNPVINKDTIPPEIEFSGDSVVSILQGGTYEEPSIHAKDNIDGDITEHIGTTGEADPTRQGLYEIVYYVQDKAGNITLKRFHIKVVSNLPITKMITSVSDTVSVIPAIGVTRFKEHKEHNASTFKIIITSTAIVLAAGFMAMGLIYDFALLPERQKEFDSAGTYDSYNLCLNKLKQTERIRNVSYVGSGIGIIGLAICLSIPEMKQ